MSVRFCCCEAEVGDELVLARRGMDRELFMWLAKSTQD